MCAAPASGLPAEPSLPATYGGPGFQLREADHAADVAAGQLWRRVGVVNEWGRLREVALARAPQTLEHVEDPDAWHMLRRPDRAAIDRELDALARLYARLGVGVHRLGPAPDTPPNFLFLRDLVFTTPWGCVVGRPASPVRAGEARSAQAGLAALGVPLLGLPTGTACFEGADALWLDSGTVLLGTGRRTNDAGAAWLRGLLMPQEVVVETAALPLGVQHLLGTVVLVDRDLALVDIERVPEAVLRLLEARGFGLVRLSPSAELREGRSMNVVVVGPRALVMPAGNPETRAAFVGAGIEVWETPVGACLAAAGAMGCMTAVLRRECT